jgi:hypothetical protein
MPTEAREQTPAGAAAFLRYYLDLVTHQAGKSGQPLRDLSKDCAFCTFIADRYDKDASAGISYRGGAISIDSLGTPSLTGDLAEFSFSLTQEAIGISDSNGTVIPSRGEARHSGLNAGASMTWGSARQSWVMNQLIINE